MRGLALVIACIALSGCADTGKLDVCKGAALQRAGYKAAIAGYDAYVASGQPVPPAVTTARAAAVTLLLILDTHCPEVPPT